jgi:microcystin-dependent protein
MGSPFIGEIRMFAGNFAPVNWMLCQGQLLSIAENAALFQLIGTTYGGDGTSTFALPDLRGRLPLSQGSNQGSNFLLGQLSGTETVTLTQQQIPSHSHTPSAQSGSASTPNPSGALWANAGDVTAYSTNSSPAATMAPAAVGTAGGNQPHDNRMPYLCVNFIISLAGIFPSQT